MSAAGKISSFDSPVADEVRVADCSRIRKRERADASAVEGVWGFANQSIRNFDVLRAYVFGHYL